MIRENKINYLATGIGGIKYFRSVKEKDIQGKVKHIQLNVQKEGQEEAKEYIVAGKFDHPELLENSLRRLGLAYEMIGFKNNDSGKIESIPSAGAEGEEYFMSGAGRISHFCDSSLDLIFNHMSAHYVELSTNKKGLEDTLGKENVSELNSHEDWPVFLVKGAFD